MAVGTVGHAHQRAHSHRLCHDDRPVGALQGQRRVLHVDDDEVEAGVPEKFHGFDRGELDPRAEDGRSVACEAPGESCHVRPSLPSTCQRWHDTSYALRQERSTIAAVHRRERGEPASHDRRSTANCTRSAPDEKHDNGSNTWWTRSQAMIIGWTEAQPGDELATDVAGEHGVLAFDGATLQVTHNGDGRLGRRARRS